VNAILSSVTGKVADRWLAAILTPGLLLVTDAVLAVRLGQHRALQFARLDQWATQVGASAAWHSPAAILLVAVGALAASTTAGYAATALGSLIRRAWMLPGRMPPSSWLRGWRETRWNDVNLRARDAELAALAQVNLSSSAGAQAQAPLESAAKALTRRDAICLVEPARPTWVADRLRAAGERVMKNYGVDLNVAWPRIWSLASEPVRSDIATAQSAYGDSARLVAWSAFYLAIGVWWWPSAVIAVAVCGAGWVRARDSIGALSELVESATDLYLRELAERIGLPVPGSVTADLGDRITALLRGEL
jgi:hypothetical protein